MSAVAEKQLSAKGLSKGSIGLIGAIAIGISCIAPDYTMSATLGYAVDTVGQFTPAVVLVGLFPMLFVALGYREMNRAIPDSGTSFTWGARAFGPWFGWLSGWGLIASTIIVLASLAQIAVTFFYQTLTQIFRTPFFAELNDNIFVNVLSVVAFMAGATWLVYRDVQVTEKLQYVLVAFQLLAVFIFGLVATIKYANGTAPNSPAVAGAESVPFSWNWFNPFAISDFPALISGITIAVFIFWGWDVVLTITEETKDSRRTPGRAAAWTIVLVTVYYLFVATSSIMFAGPGAVITESDNVFVALAEPVMGGFAIIVSLAVLSSSVASLESTFVSPARTMLAMGHYGALPPSFAKTSKFATPGRATVAAGIVAGGYYALMRPISENVLTDTVATTSIFICFYYGLTSLAAVWYFRKQWTTSVRNVFFKLVFPLIGGLFLAFMFFHELYWSLLDDEYGSGAKLGGVNVVFLLTVAILLLGVVLMIVNRVKNPGFFRHETIPIGAAVGEGIDRHFHALTDEEIDEATPGESFA
ncbi:MAG: APC family permease [Propionibacteriaceae bacterium]|jgi:amino acid transporter|nr:APC family permease [Propionibacteriaceae bacterium]